MHRQSNDLGFGFFNRRTRHCGAGNEAVFPDVITIYFIEKADSLIGLSLGRIKEEGLSQVEFKKATQAAAELRKLADYVLLEYKYKAGFDSILSGVLEAPTPALDVSQLERIRDLSAELVELAPSGSPDPRAPLDSRRLASAQAKLEQIEAARRRLLDHVSK